MGDYANYHCYGFTPREEEDTRSTILSSRSYSRPRKVTEVTKKLIIDLNKVTQPGPTPKMLLVLYNLLHYGFIGREEYCSAIDDYCLASSLIGEHQADMHKYVEENASNCINAVDSDYNMLGIGPEFFL